MGICPVDLALCQRAECRHGHCERADALPLRVCWDCGALEAARANSDLCLGCIRIYVPRPATEAL